VKYGIQKINILLNRKYSYKYIIPFVQHSSWRKCHRKFSRKYADSTVACKAMIYNIVTNLCSVGSVLDKKKSKKRWVLTEGKFDDFGTLLKERPEKLCLLVSSSV
jgi:hypothetical protein